MKLFLPFLTFLLLICTIKAVHSETWKHFINSQNIQDLAVDGDYVWCATSTCLLRWDRRDNSYRQYTIFDGLLERNIDSVSLDSQDRPWVRYREPFFPENRFSYLDNGVWHHVTEDNSGLPRISVLSMCPDKSGNMLFSSYDAITVYNGETWETPVNEVTLATVNDIAADADGTVWLASTNGAWCMQNGEPTRYTVAEGLANDTVYTVAASSDGSVWFGTANGVSRFDGSGWTIYKNTDGLLHNRVNHIAEDSGGALWFATYSGVSRFDGESWKSYTDETDLISNDVSKMYPDPAGNVWLCHENADNGVEYFNGSEWVWLTVWTEGAGLPSNHIEDVAVDGNGVRWFATDMGLVRNDGDAWDILGKDSGLAENHVTDLKALGDGRLLVVYDYSLHAGISMYDGDEWTHYSDSDIRDTDIRCMEEIDGELWFGTKNGYLKFDGESWRHVPDTENQLVPTGIMDMELDKDGMLWASAVEGLSSFDGERWTIYSDPETLSPDRLQDIEIAGDGAVWGVTEGGTLIRFENGEYTECPGIETDEGVELKRELTKIAVDSKGIIWTDALSTRVEEYQYKGYDRTMHIYSVWRFQDGAWRALDINSVDHVFARDFLSINEFSDVCCDDEDAVWYGTDNKSTLILKYDGTTWERLSPDFSGYMMQNSFEHYPDGRLIFSLPNSGSCYFNGEGFNKFDTGSYAGSLSDGPAVYNGSYWYAGSGLIEYDGSEWHRYVDNDGTSVGVYEIAVDLDGLVWFSRDDSLKSFDGSEWKSYTVGNTVISDILVDRRGTKWIGRENGLWSFDDVEKPVYHDIYGIIKIIQDSEGVVWAASRQGLVRIDENETYIYTREDGLPEKFIRDIAIDHNGLLWIATSAGVASYNGSDFETYTVENGLFSNDVSLVGIGRDNTKWLLYREGLSGYNELEMLIEEPEPEPGPFSLIGSFPNPFNAETTIEFTLETDTPVRLTVYDILGRKVRTFETPALSYGRNRIIWDATDETGARVSSGVYIYRLVSGKNNASGRMMFVK